MTVRVAINGFGRTGRAALRSALEGEISKEIDVVAVNDLAASAALTRLFTHDSVHGRFPGSVFLDGDELFVDGKSLRFTSSPEIESLPWAELGVDVVIDATGKFRERDQAARHLAAGARRVIVSAPMKDADVTVVLGVNEAAFDPVQHFVISNASCTTNCLAVLAKVLNDAFGIEDGLMSTVHGYTGDQRLLDAVHKDARRSRSAAVNIVPTTTGAARTTGVVLPSVDGHLDGLAFRVPVPDGSVTDLVALVREPATVESVNSAYARAALTNGLGHFLTYSEEPLVSTDILGSDASCVFDAGLTMVAGRLVKVVGWYDNETGYSTRLVELAWLVGEAG